ncbi:MAG: hypothetical protein APF81_05110 [Desulfosporosinus sp. BRH_c37]|nr:MAG: hypothetical protein APF81_05110 [Desulfosporosinus sp. BRH_c37]
MENFKLPSQFIKCTNMLTLAKSLPIINEDCSLNEAAQFFCGIKADSAVLVDQDHKLIGILEGNQVFKAVYQNNNNSCAAKELARYPELVVRDDENPTILFDDMLKQGVEKAIVVDKSNRFLGAIYISDFVKAVWQETLELIGVYSEALKSAHNGILVINAHGEVEYMNPKAEQLFNCQADVFLGKHINSLIPNSRLLEVVCNGKPLLACREKLGDTIVVVNRTPIIVAGKIVGAISVFQDITELESISEELEHTKKLQATLEAIVENPYEGLIVIDENSIVTMVNHFYADAIGLTQEEIIGRNILEVTPHSQMPDIIRTGQARIGDLWEINKREFMIMRIPIMEDGKVIGAIGKTLFKDIPIAIQFAKKLIQLEKDLHSYKQELRNIHHSRSTIDDLIGKGAKITVIKKLILRAAKTSSTVLITGESGTGKEVVSNIVHNAGPRKDGPFIKINCSAIPENLLESELFGYAEGAFTGARKGGKPGKFEQANHGTLFLDEIGDMGISMQTKILRAIQEREIERVGGTKPISVDVRIIAATHRDLNEMILENKFRLDLFYRLNVFEIELPPLRQRLEDIELLTSHLLIRLKQRLSTSVEGVSCEAMELLKQHHWPGNIRELENVLERAINISDEINILPEHLPLQLRHSKVDSTPNLKLINLEDVRLTGQINLEELLLAIEKEIILNAMHLAKGNKAKVASALDIHRTALYRKLIKHNLI